MNTNLSSTTSTLKANSATTVVVGMSGGVDSSVTAALLREQGYRVIGLFMKNWEETDENGVCTATKDFEDVARVCDRLDVPYYSVNFAKEYWDDVFTHFLAEYQAGRTPNPDVLCNREIKFKRMLDKAIDLGGDFLATGHYCQNISNQLVKGTDAGKDQTYFLYTIKKEILEKVMFPIGALQKSEVRKIAHKYDLATKDKKDSTGICFIGERDFPEFLSRYIKASPGPFMTLDGTRVGAHHGAVYYTVGQRKGLGLGGQGEPWFVLKKDIDKNIVYVERGTHADLFSPALLAKELSWVSGVAPTGEQIRLKAKVRYRQDDQSCLVEKTSNNTVRVVFDEPQRAVAPGQSVVFYDENVCLGGGVIDEVLKTSISD